MLKFIKGHMESIDGISIYPVTSFVIFFVFFTLLGIVVFAQRKEYFTKMSNLPLDDSIPEQPNTEGHEKVN